MANADHLERLRQGVDAWHEWRKKKLSIEPDLTWADLREANLTRTYLSQADLREVNLCATDLSVCFGVE